MLVRAASVEAPNELEIWVPLSLLLLGMLERIAWTIHAGLDGATGEAPAMAYAFARTNSFRDVFPWKEGSTTHLTPSMEMIAGYVYRFFGVASDTSEILLVILASSIVLGAAFLYYAALRSHVVPWARTAALAIFCLMPLNLELETRQFRSWEGGLASLFGAAGLFLLLQREAELRSDARYRIGLAANCAVLFFINPVLGLALYGASALFLLRHNSIGQIAGAALLNAAILVLVLAPWTLRNYDVFGRFIPLRGNGGLELALANHPAAVASSDDLATFRARLLEIQPTESRTGFEHMMASGGEIAYAERLGREASRWIEENPASYSSLAAKHLRQFYLPPAWFWNVYGHPGTAVPLKQALAWSIAIAGLLGAFCALTIWRNRMIYMACLVIVPGLVYMSFQPILRYRYLVFAPMLFLGCELVGRMILGAIAIKTRHDRVDDLTLAA